MALKSLATVRRFVANRLQRQVLQQESQVAMNRSPEFCVKLIYRYLFKAGHFPGDPFDWSFLARESKFEQIS